MTRDRRGDTEITWHLLNGNGVECSRCGQLVTSIKQLEEECDDATKNPRR